MSRTWHKKREAKHTGSARFDYSCRNHGSCVYCENNRTFKHKRGIKMDEEALEELKVEIESAMLVALGDLGDGVHDLSWFGAEDDETNGEEE